MNPVATLGGDISTVTSMYALGNVWTNYLKNHNVTSMCPPGKCPLAPSGLDWTPSSQDSWSHGKSATNGLVILGDCLQGCSINTGGKGWCTQWVHCKYITRKWIMYPLKTHPGSTLQIHSEFSEPVSLQYSQCRKCPVHLQRSRSYDCNVPIR